MKIIHLVFEFKEGEELGVCVFVPLHQALLEILEVDSLSDAILDQQASENLHDPGLTEASGEFNENSVCLCFDLAEYIFDPSTLLVVDLQL